VHDDDRLDALDITDLEVFAATLAPTIMVNPSPRSQTRTGLRYACRMSSSLTPCLVADEAMMGSPDKGQR
jgi:hypothetical protein